MTSKFSYRQDGFARELSFCVGQAVLTVSSTWRAVFTNTQRLLGVFPNAFSVSVCGARLSRCPFPARRVQVWGVIFLLFFFKYYEFDERIIHIKRRKQTCSFAYCILWLCSYLNIYRLKFRGTIRSIRKENTWPLIQQHNWQTSLTSSERGDWHDASGRYMCRKTSAHLRLVSNL